MKRMRTLARVTLAAALLLSRTGCSGEVTAIGRCVGDPAVGCGGQDLVGYSCAGDARPDEIQGAGQVVQGVVCHEAGSQSNGVAAFCCTQQTTACAFDPRIVCMDGTSRYSCMGTNRPDTFDPALTCTQGIPRRGAHLVLLREHGSRLLRRLEPPHAG
ncbi:MAG: hypothetical protein JOZ69_06760 [Myxococcales bacterium]|nr:hypothetical protein [Myxococcales bacterium]